MADFVPALNFMLPHEGGYSNDPDDPGGETNFGLSRRTYPQLDIKNLTKAGAATIYFKDWWQPHPFVQIASQDVANKVFDMAVNMGTLEGFKLLQRACCDCGELIGCDGALGPITLAAVNRIDAGLLLEAIRKRASEFYTMLAAARPSSAKFLAGWLKRANA